MGGVGPSAVAVQRGLQPMEGEPLLLKAGPARRYRVFQAAPQDARGMPAKKPVADYFL
jgi:hypothetical protein